jgi:hypothetical protein
LAKYPGIISANLANPAFTGVNIVNEELVLLRISVKNGGIFRFASLVMIAASKVESSGAFCINSNKVPIVAVGAIVIGEALGVTEGSIVGELLRVTEGSPLGDLEGIDVIGAFDTGAELMGGAEGSPLGDLEGIEVRGGLVAGAFVTGEVETGTLVGGFIGGLIGDFVGCRVLGGTGAFVFMLISVKS